MASIKTRAPYDIPKSEELLCDQFVEHVFDGTLCWALKQFARSRPKSSLA